MYLIISGRTSLRGVNFKDCESKNVSLITLTPFSSSSIGIYNRKLNLCESERGNNNIMYEIDIYNNFRFYYIFWWWWWLEIQSSFFAKKNAFSY